MTEPSREAVEAVCREMWAISFPGKPWPGFDHPIVIADAQDVEETIAPALPIELKKARNRWEQEVRERLEEKVDYAVESYRDALVLIRDLLQDAERIYEPGHEDPPHIRHAKDLSEHESVINDLDSIFGEAEPVEGENGG